MGKRLTGYAENPPDSPEIVTSDPPEDVTVPKQRRDVRERVFLQLRTAGRLSDTNAATDRVRKKRSAGARNPENLPLDELKEHTVQSLIILFC